VGLDFTRDEGTYDASSFSEIRFWAKAGPDHQVPISVHLLDGTFQHFIQEVELQPTWQEYTVVFDELVHLQGDTSLALDSSTLTQLQFFVLSADPFDYWLDDVVVARS
jgi:hypothetical protein